MLLKKPKKGVTTEGFVIGIITKAGAELQPTKFGYSWTIEFLGDGMSFPIRKTIFVSQDMSDSWKISKVLEAAGVQPRTEGVDENDYILTDIIDKPIMALLYSDQYVNVFDFLPVNASKEDRDYLQKRLDKFLSKSTSTPSVPTDPTTPF